MAELRLGETEWAAASRPHVAGTESGDACVVKAVEQGLLIAVADGLGRGPDAALAARRALRTIEQSTQASPVELIEECHSALRATRGVVLGVALVDAHAGSLAWVGVGNVHAVVVRLQRGAPARTDVLHAHNGIVGRTLPRLRPVFRPLVHGDVIVVATDGLRSGLEPDLRSDEPIERVASGLLERYAVPSDDALVLVARYRGAVA